MTLTKSDLSAIKEIVNSSIESQTPSVVRSVIKEELTPIREDIKRVEKKLNDHFNYLDRDVSYFKRKMASHLKVPVSDLSPQS